MKKPVKYGNKQLRQWSVSYSISSWLECSKDNTLQVNFRILVESQVPSSRQHMIQQTHMLPNNSLEQELQEINSELQEGYSTERVLSR